jgi:hypothetical protein
VKNAVFWDVALVRTAVSEERIGSIIGMKRMSEIGITSAVTGSQSFFAACFSSAE